MARLLSLIVLFAIGWWLWRKLTRPTPAPRPPRDEPSEPMVRCAHCGMHVPQREALGQDNRWYCSRAHLEQDTSGPRR